MIDIGSVASTAGTVAAIGIPSLLAAWYASTSLFTVPQQKEALITTFGKHTRTEKEPGLHLKAPWPFNVVAANVFTGTAQVTDPLTTKTKDDLFVGIPITIQYEVMDSPTYWFKNNDPLGQMKTLVSAAVRNYASDKDFQSLYDDREEISSQVIQSVGEKVKEFGIELKRIIVDEPKAPEEIVGAYNRVRASERLRDAANNESEAEKIRIVKRAEAEKDAQILHGEGVAGFREKIFHNYETQIQHLVGQGISKEEALDVMMKTMHMDVLRDIGHQGNMVIVTDGTDPESGKRIAELQALRPTIGSPAGEQNNAPRPAVAPLPVPGPA